MKKIKISILAIIATVLSIPLSSFAQVDTMPPAWQITVISPNGGEGWQKGTVQTIKWQIKQDSSGSIPRDTVSIELLSKNNCVLSPCPTPDPTGMPRVTYSTYIAQNAPNTGEYAWDIGKYTYADSTMSAPNGDYLIRICAGSLCDSSNSYFSITSSNSNRSPVINGISAPTILNVGQVGTWSIQASDPDNDVLWYYVNWGDQMIIDKGGLSTTGLPSDYVQTTTFTHSYAYAGTYVITFKVNDNAGHTAYTSATVQVGSTCPAVQCKTDWCPGGHLPDSNGCVNCSSPCPIIENSAITKVIYSDINDKIVTEASMSNKIEVTTKENKKFTFIKEGEVSINKTSSSDINQDIKVSGAITVTEDKVFLNEKEIKIMPDTASSTAIDKLSIKNFVIEIKDVGTPEYQINGEKEVKLLGFINKTMPIKVSINAETGNMTKVVKPWWSFLAF